MESWWFTAVVMKDHELKVMLVDLWGNYGWLCMEVYVFARVSANILKDICLIFQFFIRIE